MRKSGFQDSCVHHVTREETTVSKCLGTHFRLDPPKIRELFDLGAIYMDKRRVLADRKLAKGAYLRVHLKPKRYSTSEIDWRRTIVHEAKEYLVVNKPSGIPVHASLDNYRENVLQKLRDVTGLSLLITQRLDIPVGGLLVIAKTDRFQREFNKRLAEHRLEKKYRALVDKTVPVGRHVQWMEPSEWSPKRMSLEEKKDWLRCELTVHAVRPLGDALDVEIELHTGRTHQIRAQLSALGSPILGDAQYGSKRDHLSGIALFSSEVSWDGQRFSRPPPWIKE